LANELTIDKNLDLESGEIYIPSILDVDTQHLKRTMFDAKCSTVSSFSSRNSQRTHALNYKEKLGPEIKLPAGLHVQCCPLSTIIGLCRQILIKFKNNKCHVISTGGNAVGQT